METLLIFLYFVGGIMYFKLAVAKDIEFAGETAGVILFIISIWPMSALVFILQNVKDKILER